jgi:glutaminyl-peptide cyclotransferase
MTGRFDILLFPVLLFGVMISFCGPGVRPPVVTPRIITTLPHDSSAFTQGLFYDNGKLYESDGLYGKSSLSILDAHSGALLKRVWLDSQVFAEGCAMAGPQLVQITWREQTAFTWSLADLSPGQPLVYSGEGWGLTSDGERWYMSDGSDTIVVRNRSFTIVSKIPVTERGSPVKSINELEYVNGAIYANVWYSDSILEINPKNGKIRRIIDCAELLKKELPVSPDNVLNGIAYNQGTKHFYLTGKKWKTIFVVEIPPASR